MMAKHTLELLSLPASHMGLAREMRDGASDRFGSGVGTMTSLNATSSVTRTSYIERAMECVSTYDIVEFACGSRSMRRVLKPLLATAADRLIAVVVFPTPPFWLATVMIMNRGRFYGPRTPMGRVLH